jgi:hypothetical protein
MKRRDVLTGIGGIATTATTGLAGCLGLGGGDGGVETRNARIPPVVENRPDAVYYPTHFESMEMVGANRSGDQKIAVMYTFPHRFWTTETGTDIEKVSIRKEDTIHLMTSVWYPDSGMFVTDAAPSIQVTKGGDPVVSNNNPWAMLSQPMGFHFGDNIALAGEGTYTVTVETSAPSTRRTGSISGVGDRATAEFEFEFARSKLEDLSYFKFPDKKGSKGAVKPLDMAVPLSYAPEEDELPGDVLGTGTSGDATVIVSRLADAGRMGANESENYLVVSPRTPYNRYIVPQMAVDAAIERGGDTPFDGRLTPTLDPEYGFHYGAVVPPIDPGDGITVEFVSPAKVTRHEGYETAFLRMDPVETTA